MKFSVALWIAWYAFWVISARDRLRGEKTMPAQREPWVGRLGYLSVMLVGSALLFWRAPTMAGKRFIPESVVLSALGLVVEAGGLAFAIWARHTLGKNWSGRITTGGAQELITVRGPYRLVRHPIYSGLLLAVLGTTLVMGVIRALLGFLLILTGVVIKVGREEAALRKHFGTAYETYAHRVPALVPGIF